MATHSTTFAWKIPWMEEPGRLRSMGLLRVGHDWASSLSLFTFMHWRRKWQPTSVFLPGESQGWGAWWAAVYGVAQSRTRLKQLSSSSSSSSIIDGVFSTIIFFLLVNRISFYYISILGQTALINNLNINNLPVDSDNHTNYVNNNFPSS